MKKIKTKYFIFIIPGLIILAFVIYRLGEKIPDLFSSDKSGNTFNRKPKTNTIQAIKREYNKTLSYFGSLEPIAKVDVYSKEESRILKLYADVSDWVTTNQLLVQLDDKELLERKKQKEAVFYVEKANLNRDRILSQNKKLIYDRARLAFRDKIIPEQDLDNAKTDYETSLAQVNLSKAKLREARAAIEEISTKLNETKIYSPLDGVVSERYLDLGALVKPSQPIFKILATYEVNLIISVPESDINKIIDKNAHVKRDISIDVHVEALNRKFEGVIYKIYPTVDINTRTIKIEVRLANRKRLLKPGFYCRAIFNIGKSKTVLILPASAVNSDEKSGNEFVQIMEKDNNIITKKVKTIPFESEERIILEGINETDRVINPFNPLLIKKSSKKLP